MAMPRRQGRTGKMIVLLAGKVKPEASVRCTQAGEWPHPDPRVHDTRGPPFVEHQSDPKSFAGLAREPGAHQPAERTLLLNCAVRPDGETSLNQPTETLVAQRRTRSANPRRVEISTPTTRI